MVSWEGMGGAREAKLRLANLNNFSRLWGIGAAPRCLKSGPGVMRTGEYRLEVQCPVRARAGWFAYERQVCCL